MSYKKPEKPKIEAQLIMETYGHAPNVRFQRLAPVAVWSKLFRADKYYLDISLQKNQDLLQLSGKVLPVDDEPMPKGNIRLYHGERLLSDVLLPIDSDFSLPLEHSGSHRLECELDELVLQVTELEIS